MALGLLLWKNFKLKQRQWSKTIAEMVAPLVFFLILVAVRKSQDFFVKSPDCQFKPAALTSKGLLPSLQAFCFFGVCQNEDTGYTAKSIFNNSELLEANEALTLLNRLYSDPTLAKYRRAAVVLAADWQDPAAGKQLQLQSFFNNPTALFTNVTATAEQKDAVLNATLTVPSRLNLQVDPVTQLVLSAALTPSVAQLVCSGSGTQQNSSSWLAVAALCRQAQFSQNMRAEFNLSAVLGQMTSTASNSYTLAVTITDVPVIASFFQQVSNLTARTTLASRVSTEFGFILASSNLSSSASLSQLLSAFSKVACGAGSSRLTEAAASLLTGAGAAFAGNISAVANTSMTFTELLPPSMYCYNQSIVKRLTANVDQLLGLLGFSQLPNLMFGEMLYFPDNNMTRQNLARVNATMQRIGLLSDLAKVWIESEEAMVTEYLANSTQVDDIRSLVQLCVSLGGSTEVGTMCRAAQSILAKQPTSPNATNWRSALPLIRSAMYQLYYFTGCFKLNKLHGFDTEEAMNSQSLYLIDEFKRAEGSAKARFFAAIAFDTGGGDKFEKYRLRMLSDKVDSTRRFTVMSRSWTPKPRATYPDNFKYYTSFFLHLQELLEQGIADRIGSGNVTHVNYMRMFPTPCYIQDQFIAVIESSLPMVMTLSWIYSITLLVNAIVYEKESRLKEMMKIMGLSEGVHWLAWFLTAGALMLVGSLLMTLLLKAGSIIVHGNGFIIFLLIISFVVSTICEAFLISVFFSNSSVASAFAGVIFFVGYLPYTAVNTLIDSMGVIQLALSCLVPQVAFGIGCKYIAQWELANIGVQPSNYFESPLSTSNFPFASIILMLWLDALLMMIITWYIEKVFPGQFGVPKPFYFPFTKSYWCGDSSKAESFNETVGNVELDSSGSFEEEPKHLKVGVAVKGLCKVYSPGFCACKKSKPFTAVDNLSYKFFEGQVTSFLGHNGAGKSTTVSILTGLYTPTRGTAHIYGFDIRTQMDQIRRQLGLCPQHNVLFNQLTVEDHIYFYGMLKGLSKKVIAQQIDSFVTDVGLQHKRHEYSCNLSGGMKRKLSVAMAFVGDSKLIILDEPTAGVDPHARRAIWDVLTKFRAGRTIILTTHHMDEADILGDRICIIDKGRLVCSGSPMFLKKAFGHGYTLTLVTAQACEASQLVEFVQKVVPGASAGECTPTEVAVKLPFAEVDKFDALFEELDRGAPQLGVESYGIEDCSLEEIFLNVTGADRDETVEKDAPSVVNLRSSRSSFRKEREVDKFKEQSDLLTDGDPNVSTNSSRCATPSAVPIAGLDSRVASPGRQLATRRTDRPLLQQVKALWVKRFNVVRRSKIGFLAEFLLPTFFILLSLAMLQITQTDGDNPAMELAPWYMLGRSNPRAAADGSLFAFYEARSPDPAAADAAARIVDHVSTTTALGARCAAPDAHANSRFPCQRQPPMSAWSDAPSAAGMPDASNCRCSYEKYPASTACVEWPTPARRRLYSSDMFENLTSYNVTNYLQSTIVQYYKRRFGGLGLFVNDTDPMGDLLDERQVAAAAGNLGVSGRNLSLYNASAEMLSILAQLGVGAASDTNATTVKTQVWYENRGYVSGPAYLNVMHNAILRSFLPAGADSASFGISGWTHPITLRSKYVENIVMSSTITSAITVISIIFALSFIPASFVLFLITERETNAKHLQFVSGINPTMYWLVNHAWNMVNYLIPLLLFILIFIAFRSYEFIGSETIGPFLIIMLLFGLANAPLMYPFSWIMSVPSKAFTLLSCLNLGVGFVTTMSVTIIEMIAAQGNDDSMKATANFLKVVFLVFPHFCLGQGLMELTMYYQFSVQLGSMAKQLGVSVESLESAFGTDLLEDNPWDPTRKYILCLAAHSVVYFGLVLLLEYNFFCRQGRCAGLVYQSCYKEKYSRLLLRDTDGEDQDVVDEREKVENAAN